jgi:AraC-like DNA-binding protein
VNPRLHIAYLFNWRGYALNRRRLERRLVFDYEAEYILEGGGSQEIDGKRYPLEKGDIILRRPGQSTQGFLPYSCLCLVFSIDGLERDRPRNYLDLYRVRPDEYAGGAAQQYQPEPDHACPGLDSLGPRCRLEGHEALRALFESLVKRHSKPGPGTELLEKASILQILHALMAESAGQGAADKGSKAIRSALAFMRRNFRRKTRLAEIAAAAGLSPFYFHRLFSASLGRSPADYLNGLRLDAARESLATTDASATEIARACGFENPPYFFTLFKKECGSTPAEFRERYRLPG